MFWELAKETIFQHFLSHFMIDKGWTHGSNTKQLHVKDEVDTTALTTFIESQLSHHFGNCLHI